MKRLDNYIAEKLDLTPPTGTKHTLFPKTKNELHKMIQSEIDKNGNDCSLNHIDVSNIKDMSELFIALEFDGDISDWDVSNVTDMYGTFANSNFNQDISKWNVKRVKYHVNMFYDCSLANHKNFQPVFK